MLTKHRVCCIKEQLVECLTRESTHFPDCKKMYGVFCDREDCWSDCELYSCKTAVNIVERGESLDEKKSITEKDRREASLLIDIVVYTEHCGTSDGCMARSVLADIERRLCLHGDSICVRRIIPRGSVPEHSQLSETNLTVITSSYRLEYTASMCDPSAIYKYGTKKRAI